MTDWQQNQEALQKHIQTDILENFLRWSTIEKTMFVGNVGYVQKEFEEISGATQLDPAEYQKLYKALVETPIGNPKRLWDWTSGNLIHQYYHLKQWLDRTGQNLADMSIIVEIGAGYGAMALIIYRLGFSGRYYIIDLPEVAQLQQYYLSRTLPDSWSNIFWLTSSPSSELSCDLCIACHSLGEMPVQGREKLLSHVATKEWLFASSYEFEGVDNQAWIREFANSAVGIDWLFYPHPYQENAFYQVGVNRER